MSTESSIGEVEFSLTSEQLEILKKEETRLISAASLAFIPAHRNCPQQSPKKIEIIHHLLLEIDKVSARLEVHAVCPTVIKNRCYTRWVFNIETNLWERPEENK